MNIFKKTCFVILFFVLLPFVSVGFMALLMWRSVQVGYDMGNDFLSWLVST